MNKSNRSPFFLLLGAGSAAAFVVLSRAVARRDTASVDRRVHKKVAVDQEHPVRDLAEKASPIGKWWTYVPLATAAATYVLSTAEEEDRASHVTGAAAIVTTAVAAAMINKRFDDLLDQPPAPPGRPAPDHPVFPSGHAFGTSAVALAAAYVLSREELAPAALAFPAAFTLPFATSAARLMEEKHWISDIAGGLLAAMTLASLTLAAYEGAAQRR